MDRALSIVLCALCSCAGPPARPPETPTPAPAGPAAKPETPAPEKTTRGPAKVTTPGGAELKVPAGFTAVQRGNLIDLRDPDQAIKLFLVEIEGQDCKQAVKAAWAAADPSARWKLHRTMRPPSSKGYDEVYIETYVPTGDHRHAQALARRKGKLIWVALVSGAGKELARRNSQMGVFLTSLKAPGMAEVDLSGKEPGSITRPGARKKLVRFIEQAMKATGTPGLSIAVVEQGEVALAEGFGVREQGKPARVTPDTLMMIGSVTKSMTTLMMATVVDQGKMKWTTRVTEIDPGFKVADEALTAKLTMEHMVCACAGLPRKDLPLILSFSGKTHRDVFRELAAMAPTTGFKETFQYQNHMVAAAGYLTARALAPRARDPGRVYARAMKQRVFRPMGMRATTLSQRAARRARDRATPHAQDLEARHHVVPLSHERFVSYVAPSGGVWSTARDMSRYLITELARGVAPGGKRVASEENLTRRWKPQAWRSADTAYGLGWGVHKTKGLQLITHTGGTMGFATWIGFLPEKGVGVVMISNGTGGHLVEGVTWRRLMELWFGVDDKAQQRFDFVLELQKKEIAKLKKRLSNDAAWIKQFSGRHENPEIGPVAIRLTKGGIILDAGEYRTTLKRHSRPDGKTSMIFTNPPLAGLELVPLPKDKEASFEMRRGQERYVFKPVK